MKSLPTQTQSEQKANLLWGRFTRADQEGFWQQYETLLESTADHLLIATAQKTISPNYSITRKRSFKSSTNHYLINILCAIFGLIIGPIAVYYCLYSAKFIFAIIILVWSLGALFLVWNFQDFEADQHYLYIHKKFYFTRIPLAWKHIISIVIEEVFDEEGSSTSIKIRTNQQTRMYEYHLPFKTHKKFLKLLKYKVPYTYYKKTRAHKN